MTYQVKSPRKLIEVALPLDAINAACAYEKMPGIGAHPRGLHLWWARRPLAAARAVIFAQLVNDPGFQRGSGFKFGKNKKEAAIERARLFRLIEDLVKWENTDNEDVLEQARAEIRKSWREVCELNREHPRAKELFDPDRLPELHDPFAGGGAIPLEAQRLGLTANATDLNPIAVLINKAMIEIPQTFASLAPVAPEPTATAKRKTKRLPLTEAWRGMRGLAEDVRRYGTWMCEEARKRLAGMYPAVEVTKELVAQRPDLAPYLGRSLSAIAWLWTRTVRSPNPAFSEVHVPLVSSYLLANKDEKEAYVQPIIKGKDYRFTVRVGKPDDVAAVKRGTSASKWNAFRCLLSDTPISYDYIRSEGVAGRMGVRLMAIVADGPKGRIYLPPTEAAETAARTAQPNWRPELKINYHPRDIKTQIYGLEQYGDLFTPRQLCALATLSDLVIEARDQVRRDAVAAGMPDDDRGLAHGGRGARAYAEAISVYLAFVVDRCADFSNAMTRWVPGNQKVMNLFAKQAIPMSWDFPEAAILEDTVGGVLPAAKYIADCIEQLVVAAPGKAEQAPAQNQQTSSGKVISTDPPYYDNIGYADLSDFFYVWLRRSLRDVFPTLLATMSVPKSEELVATPYRHGDKDTAEAFFLDGMTHALHGLAELSHPEGPTTIYYAFKQSESRDEGTSSAGWETFLGAVLRAGYSIVGTWPLRSEQEVRMNSMGHNALASSIVLVCRRRESSAPSVSRREFLRELNAVLPEALDEMTRGAGDDRSPVAPVDLSQAVIGPGMAVFSKYASVLEADGSPMSIRTALQLINRFLAEGDFDPDTQFALRWFEDHSWRVGKFGEADTLSRAKGTSVEGVKTAGIVESGGGSVRLLKWSEYDSEWDPRTDTRNPVWETLHHLVRALKTGGESSAGQLLAAVVHQTETARQLAYRLFTVCERQGWADDARVYNELITSWSGIEAAASAASTEPVQGKLFD